MSRCFNGIRQLPPRTILPVTSMMTFLATACGAQAQDLCANIDYLIDQSRSKFAEVADNPNGDAGKHDATLTLAGASKCFVTKQSKRDWYQCVWEFPYRAERAYDTFDDFVGTMNECIGQHATPHSDQSVNHPDYYSSRRYDMERAEVSVSVKDKAALGNTLVFIRVQSRDGG